MKHDIIRYSERFGFLHGTFSSLCNKLLNNNCQGVINTQRDKD